MNELALEISKREGKKSQVTIAQIKEIVGHLADIFVADFEETSGEDGTGECRIVNSIFAYGQRREIARRATASVSGKKAKKKGKR